MKSLFLILLIPFILNSQSNNSSFEQFQSFIKKYKKTYTSMEEFMYRYNIFSQNFKKISELNSIKTSSEYHESITKFSDLTEQEFISRYLTPISDPDTVTSTQQNDQNDHYKPRAEPAPESYNWIEYGVIPEYPIESNCSGIGFAQISSIETAYNLAHFNLTEISLQQIEDCDTNNQVCNPTKLEMPYQWVRNNGGLMRKEDYPKSGFMNKFLNDNAQCQQDKKKFLFKIMGWLTLNSKDEIKIRDHLLSVGPLFAGMNGVKLKSYSGGIMDFNQSECPQEVVNYGVLLVGYGVENGKEFWICRNGWGKDWGENGYFRIARGKGTCGINKKIIHAS